MDFSEFLEGIEKLIVRILLWVVIIPKTLYQILTEPNWVVSYIDKEMKEGEADSDDRFDDYISPIMLFLICSVVLFVIMDSVSLSSNASAWGDDIMKKIQGVTGFFVGLGFLSLPLLFAIVIEYVQKRKFARRDLVRTLNIQCYYFSPLTLSIFSFLIIINLMPDVEYIGLIALGIAIGTSVWFIVVQVQFIKQEIGGRLLKSIVVLSGCAAFIIAVAGLIWLNLNDSTEIDGGWEGVTENEVFELAENGTYIIEISGFADYQYGNYQLVLENKAQTNIDTSPLSERHFANSFIPFNHHVELDIMEEGESVWIIEGQEGDKVDILVSALNNASDYDPAFEIYSSAGDLLHYIDSDGYGVGEQIKAFEFPESGEYFIFVYEYYGEAGQFKLEVVETQFTQIEDNSNGGQSVGQIGFGEMVQSGFFEGENVQWRFNGQAGDKVDISITPDESFDVKFDVQDKNGVSVFASNGVWIYSLILGYIYILLVGFAVILGLRSVWRNRKVDTPSQLPESGGLLPD